MAEQIAERVDRKTLPHAVARILDTKTGILKRHSVAQIYPDGTIKPRYDDKCEKIGEIERCESFNAASALRMSLQRKNGLAVEDLSKAIALPEFLPQLPNKARARREVFLACEIEDQEDLYYSISVMSGLPRNRINAYLMVTEEEIAHIDLAITDAARAELDLRIAKKMINHALKDNSPGTMVPTLFLSKVFLKWTEQGIDADGPEMANAAKALFENLSVVQTHRDATGATTAPATHLSVVQTPKRA